MLDFLTDFNKSVEKIDGVGDSSEPPRFWFSTGNYVLNKVISGSFLRGIPQGRITCLAGPSGTGKSFLAGNIVKQAQKEGVFVLVIDSENALDNDFMTAIGVDTKSDNYKYLSTSTIAQVTKVVSKFIQGYREEYKEQENAPKILIVIDSLDMLMTDTAQEHYSKGEATADRGQHPKQLKAMLGPFLQDIKHLNIAMVVTKQVYKATQEQLMAGEGVWVLNDAIRFVMSQIVMLTKLKLRTDVGSREVSGIRMKCEGFKTRFCKPFQTIVISVPYDTGIDPYNGLLEVAIGMGIIKQTGGWYAFAGNDKKWRAANFLEYAPDVLIKCEALRAKYLDADESELVSGVVCEEPPPREEKIKEIYSTP